MSLARAGRDGQNAERSSFGIVFGELMAAALSQDEIEAGLMNMDPHFRLQPLLMPYYLYLNSISLKNSNNLIHLTLRLLHTFGIFGLTGLLLGLSDVTTVQALHLANAIRNGSASGIVLFLGLTHLAKPFYIT